MAASYTAEDLYRFEVITGLDISPTGDDVAYSVEWVDDKSEKKFANIWLWRPGFVAPRRFTAGNNYDGPPHWSPDGKSIAFTSRRMGDSAPQIYVIPVDGGEARAVTNLDGQIGAFAWSPDSKEIAFCYTAKAKTDGASETADSSQQKPQVPTVRTIERLFYKLDGVGFVPQERTHIWVLNVSTGKLKLSVGKHSEFSPAWLPDGKSLVFSSNRAKDPDLDPDGAIFYLKDLRTGRTRKIETHGGPCSHPSISSDGRNLAYLGTERKGQWWRLNRLYLKDLQSGKVRCLTPGDDINSFSDTLCDIGGIRPTSNPAWLRNDEEILFLNSHHGSARLHVFDRKSGENAPLPLRGTVIGQFAASKDGRRIAYVAGSRSDPGQVYLYARDTGEHRQVSAINKFLTAKNTCQVEEVWLGGKNRLQGWIIKPPNFKRNRRYPSILQIHGGPHLQYGDIFMHEFFYLAANGYVVHLCNPRGSTGYGEAHTKAIWNDWAGPAYIDLMRWTDMISELPYINPRRMGVTGGSYGGYMTNWIIGHTTRFKAAVTQRCVSNLISFYGSSDFNWYFEVEFGNKPPWRNMENYWRQSPIKYIGKATTPTLVIHSEEDHRCPIEQGEQVFVALKRQGVPTKMLRFPEESHGLSRGGRTDRRIARLKGIKEWFDRYL